MGQGATRAGRRRRPVPGARLVATAVAVLVLGACAGSWSGARSARAPHRLDVLEAAAEDVIDQVPHGRWRRIDADVATMARAWHRYRAEATRIEPKQAARLGVALDDLAAQAATRDGLGTEQAANDVSAPVVELLGQYARGHPVEIGRLDVVGRQIVLDVDRGDLGAAGRSVARARHQWTALRDSVRRHDGTAVATRTGRTMASLDRSVAGADGPSLRNGANDLLELVDAMERLY